MRVLGTPIAGVHIAETTVRGDSRGEFARFFCERELAPAVGKRHIVQANRSLTRERGTVRGMHYQRAPHAEMKLVRCLRGRVLDVAVDLRAGSPTFLKWFAQELSPVNALMLVIPEGCAHGFQTLEDDAELLYLHTSFYEPSAEGGVHPEDPAIAIRWPLPVTGLSDRDRSHPLLPADFSGISV